MSLMISRNMVDFLLPCVAISCALLVALCSQFYPMQPVLLVLLGVSFLLFVGWLVFYWGLRKKHKENDHIISIYKHAVESMSPVQEIAVFDEFGKAHINSEEGGAQNKSEYIRRLMSRLPAHNDALHLRRWIDEHQEGSVLLSGGTDGLGQKQRWWLAHVRPFQIPSRVMQDFATVILCDMTRYLEGYTQLKEDYAQLEKFVDQAPFGLFYQNNKGFFIGANETFAHMVHVSKDDLLTRKVVDYIEGDIDFSNTSHTVLLNPKEAIPTRALLFSPVTPKGRIRACMVFPLQETKRTSMAHPQPLKGKNADVFEYMPLPTLMIRNDGLIEAYNASFSMLIADMPGANNALSVGCNFLNGLEPIYRNELTQKIEQLSGTQHEPVASFEFAFEGDLKHATAYINRMPSSPTDANITFMIQLIDISDQKRLEQQFIQSQKMQAVGQLAGGIAHDFNNLLTAMIGFCDLLLQRYMPNDPSYTDVMQIKQNANRAANLVRQLLAFSRQQTLQPKIMNVTDSLVELSALLRRLIGAGLELNMMHGRDLWPVKVDVGQFEQVVINLVVNARDAIQSMDNSDVQNGCVTIRTGHYQCHRAHRVGHETMQPGDYVLIEVIDTGVGIAPENMNHIFEPFFSTKEVGAGTGLGLSTVYGIVKQTGGFVAVESQQNVGTIFKIYLPRYNGPMDIVSEISEHKHTGDLSGQETVLLVEDEDAVRLFSARALREKGYKVLEADSGEAALKMVKEGVQFDLLITDVVMPKMDGPTLSKKIRDLNINTKIIFISGYAEDTFRKNLDVDSHIHFLPKPFTLKDLASKVRDVLRERVSD